LIRTYYRRIYSSLTVRMVLPVLIVTSLLGVGLYFFVLRSVSEFADRQINALLAGISTEVYDICDQNFTELMQSGQMANFRAVRVKKALTLGDIEDYVKRNLLACRIYDTNLNEPLLMKISPPLMEHLAGHQPQGPSSRIHYEGKLYYLTHFEFKPWDWHVDLIKDNAQYAPLVRGVKFAYTVTSILLFFSILIILFLLERLLRRPLNRIIAAIRGGQSPDYKGIHELEFLSDNIAKMKKSLEERNRWIERLYHIAVTNRGDQFFNRIADAVSEALGLKILITRPLEDEKGRISLASSGDGIESKSNFSPEGLPLQQIADEKKPVIMTSGACKTLNSARCLSDTGAESYAGLPIFGHDGEVIGTINAFGKERSFSEWDLNLIKTAGQMVGAEFELMEKEKEKEQFRSQIFRAQKLESLGVLAGGIAHDFNNLLMGIQGNASLMLLDVGRDHGFYEKLRNMEEYVQRGASLTRQLLGMARGGKYEVKTHDINNIIRHSAHMFGRTRREITIHENYQEDVYAVELDRGQIEQVLLNLFINAAQAMPAVGEIYVKTENVMLEEASVRPHEVKPGKYVKISVTDTGVGMDEETCQKIFDPFFTTKEMGRGTGLGLASAYGIIKHHDGFIDVHSEVGLGTTFHLYLPASEKVMKEIFQPKDNPFKGTGTILLVDDEEMVIDVGRQMLERLGYQVLAASGGRQAVDVFRRNRDNIDMVLLDMIMPEMGGGETFDLLRQIDPEIRVLLSSGYSIDGRAQDILNRGCNGFIQKPFNLNELSQKLKDLLKDKQPQ
jgi:two-component system cell cycle sensor histidine kinase/response regulator CckA